MTKTLTRPLSGTPDPDEALAAAQARRIAAAAALGEASTACDAAEAAYDAALGQGRDAARAAARHRDDAGVDRDVARRVLELADAELTAARERAKAAKVQRTEAEAVAKGEAFAQTTRRELKAMATSARRLIRAWAEAEIARRVALRAGAEPEAIPEVEAFRAVPGRPRRELSCTRETHWLNPHSGDAVAEQYRAQIRDNGGGTATLYGASHSTRLTERGEFERIVYLDAERAPRLVSLVEALAVPGVMADDPAGWSAPRELDPVAVLDHLDRLENTLPPDRTDRRERQVELRRVRPELPAEAAPAAAGDGEAA